MYFRDRAQAGELLANQLGQYRFENSAVLALSPGGVVVGEQIAKRLHCGLSLLMTERVAIPGDETLVLGAVDQAGGFVYNDMIPTGEMEEYLAEFRGYLEEEKLRRIYDMSRIVGEGGLVSPEMLVGRSVIMTTDGVKNGLSVDAAIHYMRTIHTEKIIFAVPVGPAEVIERLNQRCDEVHYLYLPDNFISVKHYYEDNNLPDPDVIIDSINSIVSKWI